MTYPCPPDLAAEQPVPTIIGEGGPAPEGVCAEHAICPAKDPRSAACTCRLRHPSAARP